MRRRALTCRRRRAAGPHLALVGCTASGKSALALEVARRLTPRRRSARRAGVASTPCRCTGAWTSARPSPTAAERAEVPHHLLDLADPAEDFTVTRYQAAAAEALAGIEARGHRALLVGGTGLYFQAVVDGLTPPGR